MIPWLKRGESPLQSNWKMYLQHKESVNKNRDSFCIGEKTENRFESMSMRDTRVQHVHDMYGNQWFSIAFSFYPNETITLNATSALYARQMPNSSEIASKRKGVKRATKQKNVSATGERASSNRIKWKRICALLHLDENKKSGTAW